MRTLLLALLLLSPTLAQDTIGVSSQVYEKQAYAADLNTYIRLLLLLDSYNRKLGGCPTEGDLSTCQPARGINDAKLWSEVVKLAGKVFQLPQAKPCVKSTK